MTTKIDASALRLSAVHAFLGRIYSETRLVKIKSVKNEIFLTVIFGSEPSEDVREEISIAGTEIIANISEARLIHEDIKTSVDPLPREDVIEEGWIFERAEKRQR